MMRGREKAESGKLKAEPSPMGSKTMALRYFEWVLGGEATEPLLLRKIREDIEYGTQP